MSKENLILDGHKLNWHKNTLDKWIKGQRIAPITIDCAITTVCNYNCVYCYGQLQRNEDGIVLDKDTVWKFLDDARDIGVKAVSFVSDGESTCNPILFDAIVKGRENGLDMALGTNGYLLSKDNLEKILPSLTYLRYNISAGERERYAHIHGTKLESYDRVVESIKNSVKIKREKKYSVTIGLQMVLMDELVDQVIPLTKLAKDLGVDYLVIKHCSDDENQSLGVDYSKYNDHIDILKEAESYSTKDFLVKVKWSKILSGANKRYKKCFGPQFILQISGSGIVAPCGMLFNDKYKEYHLGDLKEKSFKEIWESEKYWEVMDKIASDNFDPNKECGTLCLQHKVNEFLWDAVEFGIKDISSDFENRPIQHKNFI